MILVIALSSIVGLTLGLLGGGGSILIVPLLVYVAGMAPKEAIATSLVVVGSTAAVASIRHGLRGNVRWKIGLIFSASAMVGAGAGGYAADWFEGSTLLLIFAGMMGVTGFAMLLGKRQESHTEGHVQSIGLIFLEGAVVGFVTGLVGAGGGFLVVPALVLLGGLPMRDAVGTSLMVIALKSGAGFLGHATHIQIDWNLTLAITGAAIVGSLVGTALSTKVSQELLRKGFSLLVLVMAVWVFYKEAPDTWIQAIFVQTWPFWIGGGALGVAIVAFPLFANRMFGVSSGLEEMSCLIDRSQTSPSWKLRFLAGMVLGGAIATLGGGSWTPTLAMGHFDQAISASLLVKIPLFVFGGICVGFGARLAGGCTSGHAMSGLSQRAPSSLVTTLAFMGAGFVVTNILFSSMGA